MSTPLDQVYASMEPLSLDEIHLLFPDVPPIPTGGQVVGSDIDVFPAVDDEGVLYAFLKYRAHPSYIYRVMRFVNGKWWRKDSVWIGGDYLDSLEDFWSPA